MGIARVTKTLYRPHPAPGAAATVTAAYVGPGLERMEIHSQEARVDVPSGSAMRLSADNGRTWSAFEPLPATLSYPSGIEVWEGSGPKFYDGFAGVLVDGWLRQITETLDPPHEAAPPWSVPLLEGPGVPEGAWTRQLSYCVGRRYNDFAYYRLSWDHGRTWSPPYPFRYEDGEPFDPCDPLKPGFLHRNQAYFGANFVRHSSGTLLHCLVHTYLPDDSRRDGAGRRRGTLCCIGRWDAARQNYRWQMGRAVTVPPEVSQDGLDEPAVAELQDGRVLVVWRGTNTETTPGRKWFSTSTDAGATLTPVRELTYDDGSRFYSPSSIHQLLRHTVTGKLYWVGNISPVPPRGNWPRYPLVIAEVDETSPAIKRGTVTVIDDRGPGQSPFVEFSNFSLLEDRQTHELELYLTAYGESLEHINNANCYRYALALKEAR